VADGEQRLFIWCGTAMLVLFVIAVWPLAGFLPPPPPSDSAQEIARRYRENANGIIGAGVVMMVAGILFVPFCAAVSEQIRRIAGRRTAIASAQFGCAVVNAVWFSIMGLFWLTAAYRADRAPSDVELFNDIGWFIMVIPTTAFIVQVLCLGATILRDRRTSPLLPRWAGYYNLWSATLFVPGMFSGFVKHGPIAWNGVLSFWLEAATFLVWLVVMTTLLLRAADGD
jgi:hypothetical protein